MPHHCPLRTSFIAPSPSGAARTPSRSGSPGVRAAVAAWCLRIVGWYRFERLLASIPDSNDDFGLG
ncbi:hypothetical protein GQ57_02070 [Burkholderia sp. MSh2]|uniref:Uncharacterized protein n=1 Tax=Burkholderia paludis TaxID=1506587 RepID=A0A6P2KSU3_9BURK|nr:MULTISPECIES: hypothetical protein [Burkholderia]KEZ07398.1 hypothetical protein GQ57_02070 [Burkholderia sp. MSh2]KFG98544.1 hypothetical protein GQ56_0103265 [Burkholderia paludis]CAB3756267.1 hypothetical protein LMG30113_02636 [Burkholderia paludis]VWB61221.1 hypothetical protein BPA30113_02712 [Burkholderia paludis]